MAGLVMLASDRRSQSRGAYQDCMGKRSRGANAEARRALDVEWMHGHEHSQAIPPAYSEHIGRYAMIALGREFP
jgi:hypothetical protein